MNIGKLIMVVSMFLLVMTLALQFFSLVTINIFNENIGENVITQLEHFCSQIKQSNLKYTLCALDHIFNYGYNKNNTYAFTEGKDQF